MPPVAAALAVPEGQLRWRCRRGMKELDVLLTRYLDAHYVGAPAVEQAAFQQLLESQDPQLRAYFLGEEEAPTPILRSLVLRIIAGPAIDP